MSNTSEEQAIRRAWGDLCEIAENWDWTSPIMLRGAEKAEQREGRATNYSKIEQLAGLCESALKPCTTPTELYRIRTAHRDVMIVVSAMAERRPDELAAWRAEHGDAILAFRARLAAAPL